MFSSRCIVNHGSPVVRIYLDHNATTPLAPEVREATLAALEVGGNPSSLHAEGRAARELVELGRRAVADLVGGAAEEIVFTSGGTEADCLGVIGLGRLGRREGLRPRVLAAKVEHPAVIGAVEALAREGFEAVWLPVDGSGRVGADAVEAACREGAAVLALALANHELGTLQEVPAVAAVARAHGVRVHVDAVQAAGKVAIDVAALGADSLAVSAHKLYGPKGVGALWVRAGLDLAPLVEAGHQERERRPGTENVPGVAGFGAAAALAREHGPSWAEHCRGLAARLEAGLTAMDGVRIHGRGAPRVGNTVNAGFAGALGESIMAALDLAGVAVSTGAACTSGSVAPSPVLRALGFSAEQAVEAVRFSLGRGNTADEIDAVLAALPEIVARARRFR
ncbi:cysteine desulfurase family protein [Haliangium sp.]|uniref:cysteine desulfurase family protein n=1 Tax=Haliangium sp. TaxID=2663208 RepID=UPI003D10CE32